MTRGLLLQLPAELLSEIVSHLDKVPRKARCFEDVQETVLDAIQYRRDLRNLLLTCSTLYRITAPIYYGKVFIDFDQFEHNGPRSMSRKMRLWSQDPVASLIKKHARELSVDMQDHILQRFHLFYDFVSSLPKLQALFVRGQFQGVHAHLEWEQLLSCQTIRRLHITSFDTEVVYHRTTVDFMNRLSGCLKNHPVLDELRLTWEPVPDIYTHILHYNISGHRSPKLGGNDIPFRTRSLIIEGWSLGSDYLKVSPKDLKRLKIVAALTSTTDDGFWQALGTNNTHLTALDCNKPSKAMIKYLASYRGLEELRLSGVRSTDSNSFNPIDALSIHQGSLKILDMAKCEDIGDQWTVGIDSSRHLLSAILDCRYLETMSIPTWASPKELIELVDTCVKLPKLQKLALTSNVDRGDISPQAFQRVIRNTGLRELTLSGIEIDYSLGCADGWPVVYEISVIRDRP